MIKPQDSDKAFNTLRAQFALRGHMLTRADGLNGATGFNSQRWGTECHLPDFDAATAFLARIGGIAAAECMREGQV